MKPTTESRSCRSQARWIGVCPDGAQVRRRTGWSMKPLSSKKTRGLPRSAAPFLYAANRVFASAPLPRRRLRVPVVPASGKSTPDRGVFAQYNPDDILHEISWRRPRQCGGSSKNRLDNPPCAVRTEVFRQVGVSALPSDEACGRDVVWLSGHPCLLSPQPDAIGSRKSEKHQGFRESRRFPCPGESFLPQATGETLTRLRFLSVSYSYIRIFIPTGSLTT